MDLEQQERGSRHVRENRLKNFFCFFSRTGGKSALSHYSYYLAMTWKKRFRRLGISGTYVIFYFFLSCVRDCHYFRVRTAASVASHFRPPLVQTGKPSSLFPTYHMITATVCRNQPRCLRWERLSSRSQLRGVISVSFLGHWLCDALSHWEPLGARRVPIRSLSPPKEPTNISN